MFFSLSLEPWTIQTCGPSMEVAYEDGVGDQLHSGLGTQKPVGLQSPHFCGLVSFI